MALDTNTYLYDTLERVRAFLDDPTLEAKYDDDWILKHVYQPAQVDVLSRINLNNPNPLYLYYEFETTATGRRYTLPPDIRKIYKVVRVNDAGRVLDEYFPKDLFSWSQMGWRINGPVLEWLYDPGQAFTIQIWYTSNGDFNPVQFRSDPGPDSASDPRVELLASGDTRIWLPTDRIGGRWDRREGAYNGARLSIQLQSTIFPQNAYVVKDYQYSTSDARWYLDVYGVIDPKSSSWIEQEWTGELTQFGVEHLQDAIACRMAIRMGTIARLSDKDKRGLLMEFRQVMKTVGDQVINMQARTGNYFNRDTVDSPERREAMFLRGAYS